MEKGKKLIYADDLLSSLRDDETIDGAHFKRVKQHINDAPAVDAEPVKRGRWIMDKLEIGNPYDGNSTMIADIGNCSVCGHCCEMLPIMNYCPNCGAKLRR